LPAVPPGLSVQAAALSALPAVLSEQMREQSTWPLEIPGLLLIAAVPAGPPTLSGLQELQCR